MAIFRRYFSGSCAVAAVLCFFAQMASAAEGNAPVSGWTVGRISAKSEGGVSYCSMKNSYRNGQMLVFARDGSGANSIGLDFRKDSLEVGRQYGVTIRAGAVTRQVTALAATRQVMIMQMGIDNAFYGVLGSKGSLSFGVGSDRHVFSLDASAKALKALGDCAEGLKSGSEFAQVTVPPGKGNDGGSESDGMAVETATSPAPRIHKTVSRIKEDSIESVPGLPTLAVNESLREDIGKLRIENRKLALENQKIQGKLLERENTAVKAREEAVRQERLNAELEQLKAENRRLAREFRAGQEGLRAEALRQKAENERLAREKAIQDEISEEALRLKAENERLAREKAVQDEISAEMLRLKTEENGRLEEQMYLAGAPEKIGIESSLKTLLVKARVAPDERIRSDDSLPAGAYRWEVDDVFGSAQDLPWVSGKSFSEMAKEYIRQAASRCRGDFAEKTGEVRKAGRMDVLESEIACLDGQDDAAAAILFVMDQGRLSVVMQEGTVDQMTAALSKRDSMVSAASGID
ncbi:MAG: hypothetical protein V1721_01195 [Pseudomonadota bacterium]